LGRTRSLFGGDGIVVMLAFHVKQMLIVAEYCIVMVATFIVRQPPMLILIHPDPDLTAILIVILIREADRWTRLC
jgi:hypothetical protein